MPQTTIAVDWDGTLVDAKTGEWLPGAEYALAKLLRSGAKVIIHTCRASCLVGQTTVREKLRDARLQGAEVWIGLGKPRADVYVDDKAVPFTSWDETADVLFRRLRGC